MDENGVIRGFKIGIRDNTAPRATNLVGIESPGLTVVVPIVRHIVCPMEERGKLTSNLKFNFVRKEIPRFTEVTKEEQERMIRQNPNYGQVVCQCEKVTRAEILTAIHNPLEVDTMAGIKYRTRFMMERCQGGYCQMRITQMIEEESRKEETKVRYTKKDSQTFFDRMRGEV